MVSFFVDGSPVSCAQGVSILDAALAAGIYIPNLCHHPSVNPLGACRLCVVEIKGIPGVQASCSTTAREGMWVLTDTPRLRKLRRLSIELMLSEHPEDCSSCPVFGSCILQSLLQYCGASNGRLRPTGKPIPINRKNPLILHDMFRCVKCGRCVRACGELRGAGVLQYRRGDDGEVTVGIGSQLLIDEGCRFCGACVEICPTGALRDQPDCTAAGAVRDLALVPCKNACPAHIDIPAYIRHTGRGEFRQANEVLHESVPFPGCLGYVCTHACEMQCRHRFLDQPVAIRQLKQLAASQDDGAWMSRVRFRPDTGKKAAVVGGGPAGLSAALFLRQCGHAVTVYEALPSAGGMLRYGIPAYRLPEEVVEKEVDQIRRLGVEVLTGRTVQAPAELLTQGYDAVLLTTGAHQGVRLPIPGSDLPGTLENISFLRSVRMGVPVPLGRQVLVLGGGSVAFDCARTAVRLGAQQVMVACLEAPDAMKADPEEIRQAREEGVALFPSQSFLEVLGGPRVTGVRMETVRSFHFDENGVPVIETQPDSQRVLPCDTLIFAVGQKPAHTEQYGLDLVRGAYLRTDGQAQTSQPGVFAAGDVVTGTRSVIEAIAAGQSAAAAIDRFLGGDGKPDRSLRTPAPRPSFLGNAPPPTGQPRTAVQLRPGAERGCDFALAEPLFSPAQGCREAGRCLQCDLRLDIEPQKFWGDFHKRRGDTP